MTELTPLFAGSAGDQWPVTALFKICMKYKIITLIIIIISLGQILLWYIVNTSHTHRQAHTHAHTPPSPFRLSLFDGTQS